MKSHNHPARPVVSFLLLFSITTLIDRCMCSSQEYVPHVKAAATATIVDTTTTTTSGARRQLFSVSSEEREALTNKLQQEGAILNRTERKQVAELEKEKYLELRRQGYDEVSNTREAITLREYRIRKRKRKGLIRKQEVSLASILFPGVTPIDYEPHNPAWIVANLAESKKTQIPYRYYDLPISCLPPHVVTNSVLKQQADFQRINNIGSQLQGHDPIIAPFPLHIGVDQPCTILCKKLMSIKNVRFLRNLIEAQYRVMLQLDSLPVMMRSKELNYAVRGYPIGFKAPPFFFGGGSNDNNDMFLYNHLRFQITYREDPNNELKGIRITGFDVHPVSYKHADDQVKDTCNNKQTLENNPDTYLPIGLEQQGDLELTFSYEVQWINNPDLMWADRWDVYVIGSPDDDIHYFSIVNSVMIIVFLTIAISTILVRNLRIGYNNLNDDHETIMMEEISGWKLVHGDVFRPPHTSPLLLSVFVGTGIQIGFASLLTLSCVVLGLLNPMIKGEILTAIILLFVFCGSMGGYTSARICKYYYYCSTTTTTTTTLMENNKATQQAATAPSNSLPKNWKHNTFLTAMTFPGFFAVVFCMLNIFLSFAGAATAVSFGTIVKLFLLWICVSLPLVFLGSWIGYQQGPLQVPVAVKPVERPIPPPAPLRHPWLLSAFLGGILPFGSISIQLSFIMSALWFHQYYYVMGFLWVTLFILILTCAQVSVILCYLQLSMLEDYRWWWMSFWNCATSGVYLFVYSLWFLCSRTELIGVLPVVVYLMYMGIISILFGLFCGSIGFVSSLCFCRIIYGTVKVDVPTSS